MAPKRPGLTILKVILILLILLSIAATAYVVKLCLELPQRELPENPTESTGISITLPDILKPTQPPETTEPTLPEPEHVVATATISAQGDLLIHGGIIKSAIVAEGYDFESNFRYIAPYILDYDYAVANLETTFGGDSNPYQGWPLFNVPDAFGQAVADAGYDMLLTANNHCYDTLMPGMLRTLEVSEGLGLDTLGTRASEDVARYRIVDVNGIRIGMIAYTYTTSMQGGKPSLNGNSPVENPNLVNYFSYEKLDDFYAELDTALTAMEADGAEATIVFIHWGDEYQIQQNHFENTISQAICDMGVDVIIGGHPHVVQPVKLLQSGTDPEHKTVCVYSLGNAISNQRIHEMNLKTGHTEDGLLFTVTFEKYSDGTVYVAACGALPTWVNLGSRNGKLEYNILPLDPETRDQWKELYNLDDALMKNCEDSYDRTMALVGQGIEEANAWLTQQKQDRDAAYAAQVGAG